LGVNIKKNMKKILLTFLALMLFSINGFVCAETVSDWCGQIGGYWQYTGTGDICVCSDGYAASGGSCTDNCPTGKTYSNGSCIVTPTVKGSSYLETETEANRCTSIWCYPTNTFSMAGVNKQATYNYSTKLCDCPSGYSSTAADYFNNTVTDPKFDASSGVSGTGSSSGSSGSSTGTVTPSGGTVATGSNNVTTTSPTVSSTGAITNPISTGSFSSLIDLIVKWILDIAMVLAPLVVVYGGFTFITSAGDPAKAKTGKQIILYAAFGFLLALIAKSLVDVLKKLAGG
jgi:hypothetical protein